MLPFHPNRPRLRAVIDGDFLEGLFRREPAAAGMLFDRFQAEVNRLVRCLLGADAGHDDLVQETFETILKRIHTLNDAAALPGWIRKVTVNTVRMELRRRRWKRLFLPADEGLDAADDHVLDHDQRETARQVRRTLGGLDDDTRLLLMLRHVEGYDLMEVAEAFDVSLATVKRKLSRAEEQFARRYEGDRS